MTIPRVKPNGVSPRLLSWTKTDSNQLKSTSLNSTCAEIHSDHGHQNPSTSLIFAGVRPDPGKDGDYSAKCDYGIGETLSQS